MKKYKIIEVGLQELIRQKEPNKVTDEILLRMAERKDNGSEKYARISSKDCSRPWSHTMTEYEFLPSIRTNGE